MRTVIPILLLFLCPRDGFSQSANEPKRTEIALTGVVLVSDHRCARTHAKDILCRSSDWALASGDKTFLLYGDIPIFEKFERKRVKIVGSLEEEPLVQYGTDVIRRKLFVSSIETRELSEAEIGALVDQLRVVPWRGPKNYCTPMCWDFGFTEPMVKILQAGHGAQDVLLRHISDEDLQDQIVMLLGGVGDEHAIEPIIEAMTDGSGAALDAKTKRLNLIGNLALTNLTVSDVIWHHGGGITHDRCPDAPKSCWSKWWSEHEGTLRVGVGGDRIYSNYPNYGIYAQFGDTSSR